MKVHNQMENNVDKTLSAFFTTKQNPVTRKVFQHLDQMGFIKLSETSKNLYNLLIDKRAEFISNFIQNDEHDLGRYINGWRYDNFDRFKNGWSFLFENQFSPASYLLNGGPLDNLIQKLSLETLIFPRKIENEFLFQACRHKNQKVLETLLKSDSLVDKTKALLNANKNHEYNSLRHVFISNNKELLKTVLSSDEFASEILSATDKFGQTAFHEICVYGKLEFLESFLADEKVNEVLPEAMSLKNSSGDTPLHLAFDYQKLEVMKFLLKSPKVTTKHLNIPNSDGDTTLRLAMSRAIENLSPSMGWLCFTRYIKSKFSR